MNSPLVSVVIPFYSGKQWLLEALKSVEEQTYKNLEVVLVNDGSKENIENIEEQFKVKIHVINKINGGPASARNLGINESFGKYVAFLDSDDLWLPEKLTNQVDYMEVNGFIWSQHSYEMFWDDGYRTRIINTQKLHGDVLTDCYISFRAQTSCFVVLREFVNKHKIRFPEDKRYGEDGEFYRKLAKLSPLGYVEGVYSRFRIRGTNAGFNAKIQIHDKADTWYSIRTDVEVLNILPRTILCAYTICYFLSILLKKIENVFHNNEKIVVLISKFMYIFPYLLFRCYAKKTSF